LIAIVLQYEYEAFRDIAISTADTDRHLQQWSYLQ
jgi:hypothetical protein